MLTDKLNVLEIPKRGNCKSTSPSGSMNDEGSKSKSVTGTPRQSSALNNLGNPSKVLNKDIQQKKESSLDPLAEGFEFTLPVIYRKLKATSTRLYSQTTRDCRKRPW